MKKVLILTGIITVLAAFFASGSPDGLDKTSEVLGFAQKGIERHSLMTGYAIPFISNAPLSTALAGIVGCCLVFGVFWIIGKGWMSFNQRKI